MASAAMAPSPSDHDSIWTTQDELAYLRGLVKAKNIKAMRSWVKTAPHRKWFGPGMRVNAGQVILAARDMLAEMERTGL